MNALVRFITSKGTAWATVLIGIALASVVLGAPRSGGDTNPSNGLPADSETSKVSAALEKLPGADSTAAVVVYASGNGPFTDQQLTWLQGTPNPVTHLPSGGANEKFTRYSNLTVNGSAFVPPAQLSADRTTAVITVPLAKQDKSEEITRRVKDLRQAAKADLPAGLSAYVTGPEGFQADLAGVFAGADFTLLLFTVIVVAVLLLVTYRSPVLWLVPLIVVGLADSIAGRAGPAVAGLVGITPDASVTGILSVLVFGAGTNYALLLIARYREELLGQANRYQAMRSALRSAGPAIIASGSTVTLALLTLSFAQLEGNRALGIVCATGIVVAMIAALGLLPAALVVFGRGLFWPFVPRVGAPNKTETGLWGRVGRGVAKRPAVVAIIGAVVLIGLGSGATGIKVGLSSTEQFRDKPEAVVGQQVLAKAFPAGATTPTILMTNPAHVDDVLAAAKSVAGVAAATAGAKNEDFARIDLTLAAEPGSEAAYDTITALRQKLDGISGANALVGGQDATTLDVRSAYTHDQLVVIPLILVLVFVVLVLLLRAVVAPVLLLATVVASFFAAMGAAWLVFTGLLGLPALDLSVFLFAFLFLVALGVDYNIFLVARAQEESARLGTKPGMIKALSATGGVITSAGVLLASVFAVLGVLPLIALGQIGVIVGIGVLLDTLLVRTVIVPALAQLTGDRFWWPRRPARPV